MNKNSRQFPNGQVKALVVVKNYLEKLEVTKILVCMCGAGRSSLSGRHQAEEKRRLVLLRRLAARRDKVKTYCGTPARKM